MGGLPAGAKLLFGKDNLPPAADPDLGNNEWEFVRKATLTKVMRIDQPFAVTTIHGGDPQGCRDGYLAIDSQGHPYPIDLKVFEETFEDPDLPSHPALTVEKAIECAIEGIPGGSADGSIARGALRGVLGVLRGDQPAADAFPNAGRPADGWQGTEPADGTRRKLIYDTIVEHTETVLGGRGADMAVALGLADNIEERLLAASMEVGGGEGQQPQGHIPPTIGRIVWYREPAAKPSEPSADRAAIVLDVGEPTDDGERVGLKVFTPHGDHYRCCVRHVERHPEKDAPDYSWRWPERVG